MIEPILAGESSIKNFRHDDVEYVRDLGLVKTLPNGTFAIANKIYQEVIPRELMWNVQQGIIENPVCYILPDGSLDVLKLIGSFQQYFRKNADSWIDRWDYKEAGPQLLMQVLLQRIVNGGGQIERECALGRKRTDIFIKWRYIDTTDGNIQKLQKEVIELKIEHAKSSLESVIAEGVVQTAEYMDMVSVESWHLLVFDRRIGRTLADKIFRERREYGDKSIEVWGM